MSHSIFKHVAKLIFVAGLLFGQTAYAEDRVVDFAENDPAMNAAIEKSRNSLPEFWKVFAAPPSNVNDFSLKLAITDGKATEHFWCGEIQGNADKASCVIANEAQSVFTVAIGDRVDVDPAIISDWMYRKDGKIVGGQTIRVIVTTLPPEEAAEYKAMLADE